ncbi:hypothetical protein GCM10027160_38520 [Streptomyces calidiresistens]
MIPGARPVGGRGRSRAGEGSPADTSERSTGKRPTRESDRRPVSPVVAAGVPAPGADPSGGRDRSGPRPEPEGPGKRAGRNGAIREARPGPDGSPGRERREPVRV